MLKILRVFVIGVLVISGCSGDIPDEVVTPVAKSASPPEAQVIDLSPAAWPKNELDTYLSSAAGVPFAEALATSGMDSVQESGNKGLVAATFASFAVHSGVKALEAGGNAMDALITTVLTQVALHMGGATSYAGHGGIMYFDAKSGEVHNLNASYASVLGEDDPLSIPSYGNASGRAVLVPGFLAGVEAAHQRFGRIPFGELFEPAIYLAEEGFTLSPFWARFIEQREYVITRRPEGRAKFLKENGELLAAGDLVRQPEMAGFLRRIAEQGSSYMYEGAWAQKFVDVVREEGGKMTLEDLKAYRPAWRQLEATEYQGYQLFAGAPLVQRLKLAQMADLKTLGHYSESPEALYWLIKISRVADLLPPHGFTEGLSFDEVKAILPDLDISEDNRYSKTTTEQIWNRMHQPVWDELESRTAVKHLEQAEAIENLIKDFALRKKKEPAKADASKEDSSQPNHTAGAVVIDAEGNMAVMNHSVTSAVWGELGIFVEGVSVVDPGAFAQRGLAKVGPGKLLGSANGGGNACPVIVVKNNTPFIGCGNVGSSFDLVAFQGLVNMLIYGLPVEQLSDLPMFRKNWPPGKPVRQPAGDGFSAELLAAVKAMGIDFEQAAEGEAATHGGTLVVATADPENGTRKGTVTQGNLNRGRSNFRGRVEAQK